MTTGINRAIIALSLTVACTQAIAQDIQDRRRSFISKLMSTGVFHKLERPAKLCHLWVGPKFGSLAFDDKAQFVNVVYAYCVTERPSEKIVVLKDFRSGKQIGTYSEIAGGLRLK